MHCLKMVPLRAVAPKRAPATPFFEWPMRRGITWHASCPKMIKIKYRDGGVWPENRLREMPLAAAPPPTTPSGTYQVVVDVFVSVLHVLVPTTAGNREAVASR